MRLNHWSFILSVSLLWAAAALTAQITPDHPGWPAEYPDWWYDADPLLSVVDTTKLDTPANSAPLLQGQLWHMADRGIAELDEQLALIGGAGFELADFQEPGATPAYAAPANLGQLKNIASKFYDRFEVVGFGPGEPGWPSGMTLDSPAGYPWSVDTGPGNLSPANLGQAKFLFSWDLTDWATADTDGDDLPDWWERFFGAFSPTADNDGDGWTNAEEEANGDDPNTINAEIAPPTVEVDGNYEIDGGVYELTDGGDLSIRIRPSARDARTYYIVESPHREPYLRFDGGSSSPISLSGEPADHDPEAKTAPVLQVDNGVYTIRAKSYLEHEGTVVESEEAEWTIEVRPYPRSGSLPDGITYRPTAYYDPDTGKYHDFAFDVPQSRRRFTSAGWLTDPESSINPDHYDGFIPDLTSNSSPVFTAYGVHDSYSENSLSIYWNGASANVVSYGSGWAAGREFYVDFDSAFSHKRYYGDSKSGWISDDAGDVSDVYEENLGQGWMTSDGFVPDMTRTVDLDDIYYDDERGRLTQSAPQGFDDDEDLGEGRIAGWMSRFVSEDAAVDYDRDIVPDATEREFGLNVGGPFGGREDSDNDGLDDAAEIHQGSDPSNEKDDWASPGSFDAVERTRVPVTFTVGDQSGSHSEQWELEIYNVAPDGSETLETTVRAGLGVLASREIEFSEGFRRKIKLNHVRGEGDFDYTFKIDIADFAPEGAGIVIDDPSGITGVKSNVTSDDLSGEVTATVPGRILKTRDGDTMTLNLGAGTRSPVFFEAAPNSGPGTFVLMQNNDKIRLWTNETPGEGEELTGPGNHEKDWSLDDSQLAALNDANRIYVEPLEVSDEADDTTVTLRYFDENDQPVGEAAEIKITIRSIDITGHRPGPNGTALSEEDEEDADDLVLRVNDNYDERNRPFGRLIEDASDNSIDLAEDRDYIRVNVKVDPDLDDGFLSLAVQEGDGPARNPEPFFGVKVYAADGPTLLDEEIDYSTPLSNTSNSPWDGVHGPNGVDFLVEAGEGTAAEDFRILLNHTDGGRTTSDVLHLHLVDIDFEDVPGPGGVDDDDESSARPHYWAMSVPLGGGASSTGSGQARVKVAPASLASKIRLDWAPGENPPSTFGPLTLVSGGQVFTVDGTGAALGKRLEAAWLPNGQGLDALKVDFLERRPRNSVVDYDLDGDGDLTLLAERDDIRLTAVNSNADIDVYLVHRMPEELASRLSNSNDIFIAEINKAGAFSSLSALAQEVGHVLGIMEDDDDEEDGQNVMSDPGGVGSQIRKNDWRGVKP